MSRTRVLCVFHVYDVARFSFDVPLCFVFAHGHDNASVPVSVFRRSWTSASQNGGRVCVAVKGFIVSQIPNYLVVAQVIMTGSIV